MGTAALNSSRFPRPHTHHIEVLGNAPFPKLLHPLTNIREAGIVIIRILLCQVVNVSQGTILRGGGERKKRDRGQVGLLWKSCRASNPRPPRVTDIMADTQYLADTSQEPQYPTHPCQAWLRAEPPGKEV